MPQMIGEILDIPASVHAGDFVLKLVDGVRGDHAQATLDQYVATPQLAEAFGKALELIQGALQNQTSKGVYLHGSFGAGKSHFMAVLALLLDRSAGARAVPELTSVVTRHQGWLGQKRFLVLPVHMIGKASLESAVFGGYARYVEERHADKRLPGFYAAERLFDDARGLRAKLGDEVFFNGLNQGRPTGDGWGALAAPWTGPSFQRALLAPGGDPERGRLVGDLLRSYFTAYAGLAGDGTGPEGFVGFDEGMAELTSHAKDLGYDGVILFLDEVILWLASHASDQAFLNREAQKLAKLVEYERPRAIPVVSFLARQRDLRELVSDHVAGVAQATISDVLRWWEGRFGEIRLEDRNLPAIISKRLLKPRNAAAVNTLAEAFAATHTYRQTVLDVLRTRNGSDEQFRQVYPFSPVLVETLVAVSSVLQRERTALKLLVLLLVRQRDTLPVGDLVPVGDLWDVIADGAEEPFGPVMRERFKQARDLWRQKLVPLLEDEQAAAIANGVTPEMAARQRQANAGLLKSLLLAALAEGVEALTQITAERLVALNHGTIRSPIPGNEAAVALGHLRRWAGRVGEIRLDGGANPVVHIHLASVDTTAIIEQARGVDSLGVRRQLVRKLVFEAARIPEGPGLVSPLREFVWRGSLRRVEVLFVNVRELAPDAFRTADGGWKLFIDYPFDETRADGLQSYTPSDDRALVNRAIGLNERGNSIVWLPTFLSQAAQDDLGTLVVLEHLLSGTQLDQQASQLSVTDRQTARSLLDSQRTALRQGLQNALLAAYGLTRQYQDRVDPTTALEEGHLYTLAPGLRLVMPAAADLGSALDGVLAQGLDWEFPDHPRFPQEIRDASIRKTWRAVQLAGANGGRAEVPVADRAEVRSIVIPLRLGQMGEAHLALADDWNTEFAREEARDAVPTLTVKRVREWIDRPRPRGLARALQDLVILTWVLRTDRAVFLNGGPAPGLDPGQLRDEMELRPQRLPDAATWRTAHERAAAIFGYSGTSHLSAAAISALAEAAGRSASGARVALEQYLQRLDHALAVTGTDPAASVRRSTAQRSRDLVVALAGQGVEQFVRTLATAQVTASLQPMGTAVAQADALARTLDPQSLELVPVLRGLSQDLFEHRVQAVLGALTDALKADEHAVPLGAAASSFHRSALALIAEATRVAQPPAGPDRSPVAAPPPTPATGGVPPAEPAPSGPTGIRQRTVPAGQLDAALDEVRRDARAAPGSNVELTWRILP